MACLLPLDAGLPGVRVHAHGLAYSRCSTSDCGQAETGLPACQPFFPLNTGELAFGEDHVDGSSLRKRSLTSRLRPWQGGPCPGRWNL